MKTITHVFIVGIAMMGLLLAAVGLEYLLTQETSDPAVPEDWSTAAQDDDVIPERWHLYSGEAEDVSFWHPPEATTRIENDRAKVTYLGPDNTMGSEITDGFTVFISQVSGESVPLVAQRLYEQELEHGTSVASPSEDSRGHEFGYTFTVETALGTQATHLVVPDESESLVHISYTIIDPAERNYADLVAGIIDSVEVAR